MMSVEDMPDGEIYAEFLGDIKIKRQRIFGTTTDEIKQAAIKLRINPINLRNWNQFINSQWIPYNLTN